MATPTIYYTSSTSPSLDEPRGLAIDPINNRILICDSGNNRVVLCRIDGLEVVTTLSTYDGNTFSSPNGCCYYNGYFYVCDNGNNTLVRLRARDLAYKDYFGVVGEAGSTSDKLSGPQGVTHDKTYLYVTNGRSNQIKKLVLETLAYSDQTTSINGSLSNPVGIVYKSHGGEALFIADYTNNRIIKCMTDFTYIEENDTDVSSPTHLAFVNDMLHVANGGAGNDDIVVLSSDGLSLQTSLEDTTTTLDTPQGLAIFRDALFIADGRNDRITIWRRYNPRDDFTSGTPAKFGGEFYDNPFFIVGHDTVVVGDTQEYGTPNRWKEENTNVFSVGAVRETAISSTWTEES